MLSLRGIECWVFVASNRDAAWDDQGVRVREIDSGNLWIRTLSRLPLRPTLVRLCRQIASSRALADAVLKVHRDAPFDIVQTTSYTAPGYALLRRKRPFPLVCRISSHTPTVRAAYGAVPDRYERISDRLESRLVLGADGSFAPSVRTASTFRQLEGAEPAVIRTPVELPACEPASVAAPTPRYLVFVGTLSRIKGADLLAEALPGVLSAHPELSFLFVGRDDGIPGVGSAFELIASRCGPMASRLGRYPELPKESVCSALRDAVALVLPSRIDNCPNVVLEAHAAGIPVVGTADSSIEEMVEDGRTGFLVPGGDPAELAAAMSRCLRMGAEERAAMKEFIRAHVEAVRLEDRIGKLTGYFGTVVSQWKERHG
jgi:glycosyltransferase involved in cell wall biosynthesis